jgi:hypothetical protein
VSRRALVTGIDMLYFSAKAEVCRAELQLVVLTCFTSVLKLRFVAQSSMSSEPIS